MTKPINPNDVIKIVPDQVIASFNELIQESWTGHKATVFQDEAVARIQSKMDCPRATIFAKGWLDVESLFRKEGWTVKFDKPAYCETYKAFFVFSKTKK
jgi:hypothetical protein